VPQPPRIGPAPTALLGVYNRLNNTQYTTTEADAFNITWQRVDGDNLLPIATAGVSSGTGGSARALPIPLPEFAQMHLTRFENLTSNHLYYIRAKTVLTVTRGAGGVHPRTYSYVVQASTDPEFAEGYTIEFVIPPLVSLPANPVDFRRRESGWSEILRLYTTPSGEGGGIRPAPPIPERDWEVTYDAQSVLSPA
jgi:hypothetical protein